jgi:hypothetical protein
LNGRLGVFAGLLLLAAGCLIVLSCGEEGTGTAPCTNCDYWDKAFGRDGRYPSACPADPMLIAFCDTMDLTGSTNPGDLYYHIWVAVREETTQFYQITSGPTFDLKPVWSPDGTRIAFERGQAGAMDIYVVDVGDLENPGEPVRFTDNRVLPESNSDAAWITYDGTDQIAFSNSTNGGSDVDIFRKPYPGPGEAVRVTYDPSDFAADQNGVLGFIFRDMQSASNGSGLIAFASPDRSPVGDIYVVAKSEEDEDTSSVAAHVYINGRDSGETTPALFRYRPVQDSILIEGQLTGYCSRASLAYRDMQPDTVNVALLDFVHTHGNLAATSIPGVLNVVIGEIVWSSVRLDDGRDSTVVDTVWVQRPEKTPDYDPHGEPQYRVYTCVPADTVLVYAASVYGPCSDTLEVEVTAGDTSYVQLICSSRFASGGAASRGGGFMPVLGQQPEPYSLWVVDVDTDALYLIARTTQPISNPALSPDGRYIAYVTGEGAYRQLVVSGDIQALLDGTGSISNTTIGLPGSAEDIECYRFPERVSWIYTGTQEYKLVASLSKCRSGNLTTDYEVWIADISRFIQ